jgi:hypothetical protein
VVTAGIALAGATTRGARAQDWTTAGYDAQRTSWVRADGRISAATLRRPGFQLLWKLNVADASTGAPTPPVLLDLLIGYRGFRALAFVGAPSDRVVAIDTDLGQVEWERRLALSGPAPACARAMAPSLARPTNAALPTLIGGARRTGQPARSAVGEPGEGAVTLAPRVRRPEAPRVASPPGPPESPRPRPSSHPFPILYVLSSDGMVHTLNVMDGADAEPPLPFLPSHAIARGLIVVDDVVYVATSRGCGTAPNAVWALDLGTHQVTTWRATGRIAGVSPAIAPDGTIYVTTGDGQLAALEPRSLKPRKVYRSGGPAFVTSPVIFHQRGSLAIAASSRDGRIRLFDGRHTAFLKTPLVPRVLAAELTTWADSDDTRWLLAPANSGGIVACKVVQQDTIPTLQPGWVSRDMSVPLAAAVVNDVIFAVSRRVAPSLPVILRALDGATGNELWNSGVTIAPVAQLGLSAGGSEVYVATGDGVVYAFGFPLEH